MQNFTQKLNKASLARKSKDRKPLRRCSSVPKVGMQKNVSPKSYIRKFLGSFRYHKSANFFGVPVQNRKYAHFYDLSGNCTSANFLGCASQPAMASPHISHHSTEIMEHPFLKRLPLF
jgi:hypothetical protein